MGALRLEHMWGAMEVKNMQDKFEQIRRIYDELISCQDPHERKGLVNELAELGVDNPELIDMEFRVEFLGNTGEVEDTETYLVVAPSCTNAENEASCDAELVKAVAEGGIGDVVTVNSKEPYQVKILSKISPTEGKENE